MTSEQERQERNEVFSGQKIQEITEHPKNNLDLGFEIPVENIPLPSKGLIYPEGNALHQKKSLDIRSMTTRDMDILNSPALAKKGTTITELLKACLVDKTINVKDMITGDRDAIMVALRTISFGSEYLVEISCPKCGENQELDFDLREVPFRFLKVKPINPGENKFSLKLPRTKKDIVVKFLTGKEEEEILAILQRKKKNKMLNQGSTTTRMMFSIVEIDGKDDRSFISKFISYMPARDVLHIQKFLNNETPMAELKGELDCVECGENSEVDVPIGASFFWPDK